MLDTLKFILFFIFIPLVPINLDAFGLEQTSRDIGFVNKYMINTEEGIFEVTAITNFLISSHTFSANEKILHFDIVSSFDHENIGEIIIPRDLIDGKFTVSLDGTEISPYCWNDDCSGISTKVSKSSKSSVITIIFDEKGERTIDIIATENLGGGCLIATATFSSEMAPQVQFLREIRDNTILQTESGFAFMFWFNQFYYSFSPAVADYERENPAFKEAVKLTLTPLLTSLTLLQYTDIDSESEMLGYGIGVILLNIGMYFVAPVVLIMKVRKRVNIEKLDETYA